MALVGETCAPERMPRWWSHVELGAQKEDDDDEGPHLRVNNKCELVTQLAAERGAGRMTPTTTMAVIRAQKGASSCSCLA